MNIDRISQTQPIPATDSRQNTDIRAKISEQKEIRNARQQDTDTQVSLSRLEKQFPTNGSHDVDYARLAQIRAQMDAGELQIDRDKIAAALVNDIFQIS
ncbi:MAG: flagellar biosynthesis anti-sigma factor FlgM [Enterobacteriaceae bacterium]|jgi:negative regulator of flagellin synthesis FlgM|nr:flagellar biosynthesis anti-sigma factor FlgM [Enterobacteriaceae bacterium]